MEWNEVEVTTTQHPNGDWRRVTLRSVWIESVCVWQVARINSFSDDYPTSECHWEFTDRGDAMVKYREVR